LIVPFGKVRMKRFHLEKIFYWVFGVLTCAYYAFETEWVCSQSSYLWALFLPLWLMPISNASVLLLHGFRNPTPLLAYVLRTLNSLALIVACILTVVLSPFIFLASIVSIVGVPWLIISPIYCLASLAAGKNPFLGIEDFALFEMPVFYFLVAVGPIVTTLAMRVKLANWSFNKGVANRLSLSSCFALIICAVVVCEFPSALTHACSVAMTNSVGFKQALLLLRAVGDDHELLRYCYGESESLPWFFFGNSSDFDYDENPGVDRLTSREVYYRVTGKPFNSAPRPSPPSRVLKNIAYSGTSPF
jgi:hypothetical protein